MLPDWSDKGFVEPPRQVFASGEEVIYRVGGGPASVALGSFFSPLRVGRVSQAELMFNTVKWGNRCRYVATYRVRPGTQMWVGRVAHAARDVGDRSAVQIYIEHPLGRVELVRDVEPLKQDLFVSTRTGHA